MPELPDITVYAEHVRSRMLGQLVERARALSPFVLRTATPPLDSIVGKRIVEVRTLGKRIVLGFEGSLFVVVHLMIAGRPSELDAPRRAEAGRRLRGGRALAQGGATTATPSA